MLTHRLAAMFLLAPISALPVAASDLKTFKDSLQHVEYNPAKILNQVQGISKQFNTDTNKYTLSQATSIAISSNPVISQYFYAVKAQEQSLIAKQMLWMPQFTIESEPLISESWATKRQNPVITSDSSGCGSDSDITAQSCTKYNVFSNEQYSEISATLTWNIIDFTRTPKIKTQYKILDQQKNLYNLALRKLIADVSKSYIKLQANKQKLQAYIPILKATHTAVQITSSQVESGFADIGDLSQAQNQELNMLNNYLRTYNKYIQYSTELSTLMNLEPDTFVIPSDQLQIPNDWPLSLPDTILSSKQGNEYAMSLRAKADAASWQAATYRNSYVPQLFLYIYGEYLGAYGVSDSTLDAGNISSNIFRSSEYNGYAGIGFTWTFDGGTSYYDAKSSDLNAMSLKEQANLAELNYIGNVKSAYAALETGNLGINIAKEGVRSAQNNLLVLETVSTYGLLDITTKVQSINLYMQSIDEQISSLVQSNLALSNLYRYTSIWPPYVDESNPPFNSFLLN